VRVPPRLGPAAGACAGAAARAGRRAGAQPMLMVMLFGLNFTHDLLPPFKTTIENQRGRTEASHRPPPSPRRAKTSRAGSRLSMPQKKWELGELGWQTPVGTSSARSPLHPSRRDSLTRAAVFPRINAKMTGTYQHRAALSTSGSRWNRLDSLPRGRHAQFPEPAASLGPGPFQDVGWSPERGWALRKQAALNVTSRLPAYSREMLLEPTMRSCSSD
jgi:hypothetical protein